MTKVEKIFEIDSKIYKREVKEVSNEIGDARRDGLWGDSSRTRPFSVALYKEVVGRYMWVYKYFKTEIEAKNFRDKLKKELAQGLYSQK